jgi:hypothetical protein
MKPLSLVHRRRIPSKGGEWERMMQQNYKQKFLTTTI